MNEKQQTPATQLLSELLNEKATNAELYAKLWETDPKAYGADAEEIAKCKGQAEAYKIAAELVAKLNA